MDIYLQPLVLCHLMTIIRQGKKDIEEIENTVKRMLGLFQLFLC